jgi:hypothetical protein
MHFLDSLCWHNAALAEFPITRGLFNGGDVTNLPRRIVIRKKNGERGSITV